MHHNGFNANCRYTFLVYKMANGLLSAVSTPKLTNEKLMKNKWQREICMNDFHQN